MAPIDDETLDRLLTGHLSARLDGQLGRAEPAFRRRLAEAAGAGTAAPAIDDVAPLRLVPADDVAAGGNPNWPAADADDSAPPALRPRSRRVTGGWLWASAGTALAAAVAAVFVVPRAGLNPVDQTPSVAVTPPTSAPANRAGGPPVVRYVHNRTWDEGTHVPGGTAAPVRQFRHQTFEHVRFYDAERGAWVELVVPHEDVEQFELETY